MKKHLLPFINLFLKKHMLYPFLLSIAQGCGYHISPSSCNKVPHNQKLSFLAKWETLPIPVAITQQAPYNFTSSEETGIKNAIETWNNFFYDQTGKNVFELQNEEHLIDLNQEYSLITEILTLLPSTIAKGIEAQYNLTDRIPTRRPVMIFKGQNTTKQEFNEALAFTLVVQNKNKNTPSLVGLLPSFRTSHIIVSGKYFPATSDKGLFDLETAILHELGHLLGLGHSCGNMDGGSLGYLPSCYSPSTPHEFMTAVMFPYILPWKDPKNPNVFTKRILRTLNDNDKDRALCLY